MKKLSYDTYQAQPSCFLDTTNYSINSSPPSIFSFPTTLLLYFYFFDHHFWNTLYYFTQKETCKYTRRLFICSYFDPITFLHRTFSGEWKRKKKLRQIVTKLFFVLLRISLPVFFFYTASKEKLLHFHFHFLFQNTCGSSSRCATHSSSSCHLHNHRSFFVMAAVFKLSSTSTLLEIVFVSHCAKASWTVIFWPLRFWNCLYITLLLLFLKFRADLETFWLLSAHHWLDSSLHYATKKPGRKWPQKECRNLVIFYHFWTMLILVIVPYLKFFSLRLFLTLFYRIFPDRKSVV